MVKESKDLVLFISVILLIVSIAKFFRVLPPIITISGVNIFLDKLAIYFLVIGVGGIVYYIWGR